MGLHCLVLVVRYQVLNITQLSTLVWSSLHMFTIIITASLSSSSSSLWSLPAAAGTAVLMLAAVECQEGADTGVSCSVADSSKTEQWWHRTWAVTVHCTPLYTVHQCNDGCSNNSFISSYYSIQQHCNYADWWEWNVSHQSDQRSGLTHGWWCCHAQHDKCWVIIFLRTPALELQTRTGADPGYNSLGCWFYSRR